jgi:DNA-directed RNA polymerase specialized sigma subunit
VADDPKKEHELSIFEQWQKHGKVEHFQQLYTSMKPLIYEAAKKASFGSNVPESAHRIYAAQNFLNALKTFDPTKGRAIQSHVYDTVHQKAKRLNYLYQNFGHMPEPRAQSVGLYQSEYENLKATLGREPSTAEIADKLHWSMKAVANIQKELHKDLALGEGTEEHSFFESSRDKEILGYLYYDLSNEEKVVYEYIFGKNGKPRLTKGDKKVDYDGIAHRMGVSTSKVRTLATSIGKKLDKALKK